MIKLNDSFMIYKDIEKYPVDFFDNLDFPELDFLSYRKCLFGESAEADSFFIKYLSSQKDDLYIISFSRSITRMRYSFIKGEFKIHNDIIHYRNLTADAQPEETEEFIKLRGLVCFSSIDDHTKIWDPDSFTFEQIVKFTDS